LKEGVELSRKKINTSNKKIDVCNLTCVMCGKLKKLNDFFQSFNPIHQVGRLPYCKECLKDMCLDENGNINLENVKKMLKLIDRPFIYELFKTSMKSGKDPIGMYMKNIAMKQYKYLGWKDSIFEPDDPQHTDNSALQEKNNKNIDINDDIIEFFGEGYTEDEYRAMYRKYNFLKNNYPEKTNMHIEALKTYVRFKVKEEFATARGDIGEAAKWAELATKAATNAKINPSQLSAADLQNGLSTFGQLVRAVEQAVDIIPILPRFKKKPKDSVDFNLWCYINYIRDLKGLPLVSYEEIYAFYEKRKREYVEQESADIFEKEEEDENGEL
jgi:hypothetical protein